MFNTHFPENCAYLENYYYYYYYYLVHLSFHPVKVVLTLVQTKQVNKMYIKETIQKDNVEKYGRAKQATDVNIIWRMRIAC